MVDEGKNEFEWWLGPFFVTPSDTVIGDVVLAVLKAAHGQLRAVRCARAVRVGGGDHRGGQNDRSREVTNARGRFFDELAGDHGLWLDGGQRRLDRSNVSSAAYRRGDNNFFNLFGVDGRGLCSLSGVRLNGTSQ